MKKIVLVVFVIVAVTIGILKFWDAKREIEVSQLENSVISKEDDVLTVKMDEFKEEDTKETEVEIPQETQKKNDNPYYIKINYQQNVVTIYAEDEQGNYTKPIKAMVCSCGTATPKSGTYKISDKYVWRSLFGGVSGQYATRIVNHILFHSVPYVTYGDKNSLEYWEYDKLGTTASAGCIRLTVEDAKWIFDNCVSGTQVEFYSDSDPGPLGKPTAQKISEDEAVRGWDPTDPDANNPWNSYVRPIEDLEEDDI